MCDNQNRPIPVSPKPGPGLSPRNLSFIRWSLFSMASLTTSSFLAYMLCKKWVLYQVQLMFLTLHIQLDSGCRGVGFDPFFRFDRCCPSELPDANDLRIDVHGHRWHLLLCFIYLEKSSANDFSGNSWTD